MPRCLATGLDSQPVVVRTCSAATGLFLVNYWFDAETLMYE